MRFAAVVVAIGVAVTGASSSAQTAIIRGRVVADLPGVPPPIANARVTIAPAGAIEPVFTDGSGRFEVSGLAAGRYTLTVEKTGYAKTRYGASNDLEPPMAIEPADGEAADGIEVRMPIGAVVMGRLGGCVG